MPFKFQSLEVWQRAVEYIDLTYAIAERLPASEQFNLRSQLTRAATSVALNIAEGSTSQSDPEQARFLAISIRSLIETVACLEIIRRRNLAPMDEVDAAYAFADVLQSKLQAFRRAISNGRSTVREDGDIYAVGAPDGSTTADQ